MAAIPALVSQEPVDQVQAKLSLNRQQAARHTTVHTTVHTYLLRALVSWVALQGTVIRHTSGR